MNLKIEYINDLSQFDEDDGSGQKVGCIMFFINDNLHHSSLNVLIRVQFGI